jgi:hypothetical protein
VAPRAEAACYHVQPRTARRTRARGGRSATALHEHGLPDVALDASNEALYGKKPTYQMSACRKCSRAPVVSGPVVGLIGLLPSTKSQTKETPTCELGRAALAARAAFVVDSPCGTLR